MLLKICQPNTISVNITQEQLAMLRLCNWFF